MTEVLESHTAFKNKYVKNPIIRNNLIGGICGLGTSGAIIGVASSAAGNAAGVVAATTGFAGFAGHFIAWPLIGGLAGSYVSTVAKGASLAAAKSAVFAVFPVAFIVGCIISAIIRHSLHNKKESYQKITGLEKLAETVGSIIFLPLLEKYKKLVEENPELKEKAIEASVSRITEFGYKKEYAQSLVAKSFDFSSEDLAQRYKEIIEKLNALNRKDFYEGIPKYEIPPKGIQKLAFELSNT